MLLCYIFGASARYPEGLWAVQYSDDSVNIFDKTFDNWRDAEWMFNFCSENIADVENYFGPNVTPASAADELMEEAEELERNVLDASTQIAMAENLQAIFKPLDDRVFRLQVLQQSKAKTRTFGRKWGKHPRLRIYAIRINEHTYVVTGGAIKLSHKMNENELTQNEVIKIDSVLAWLKSGDVTYPEDLKELS